jgi:small subunit ribosomal protein S17
MAEEQDKEMTDEQELQESPAAQEPAGTEAQEPVVPETQEPAAPEAQEPAAQAAGRVGSEPAAEQLPPKERRRKVRSTHTGSARAPRSPEERQAEREAVRRTKALKRRARRLQERAKQAERRASAPAPQALAPVHAPTEGARRVRQGVVVSNKANKTITVRIDVARRHRRYEKILRSSSTLHAHDENNEAHEGDVVRVVESRPLSRTKRWRLVDVLERAR